MHHVTLVLVAIATLVSALSFAAGLWGMPLLEALRLTIRVTARQSLLLFVLAYAASALACLFAAPATRWLRQHRRSLGLAFATSHAWHLVAILTLLTLYPAQFMQLTSAATRIGGSVTYVFIAAMAATSFDATARAIGPRNWRLLHGIGGFAIWTTFLISEGKRVATMPAYAIGVALLLGVMLLRLIAWWRRARPVTA